jgi:DNA-binding NtrC family response regulator
MPVMESLAVAGRSISPSTSRDPAVQARIAVRRISVLVVDDEPLIRWSIAETLLDHDIGAVTAEDGRAAIKAVANAAQAFDVVLLDYQLPDVANWTLLTLLRQMTPGSAIVLMTAFHTPELAADARRRGACCVLRKPFDLPDLADLIRRAGESRFG